MDPHQITQLITQLAQETDAAKQSAQFTQWIDTASKFHNYSLGNVILIAMQKPGATHVAGYHAWQDKFNRQVMKGEHGIAILAPCAYKSKDDEEDARQEHIYYKTVYVFDISQTTGDPLPDPPDWKSPARQEELQSRMMNFANANGILVEVKELDGETQGTCEFKHITLSPRAGTKTLIHELAHALLDHSQAIQLTRETREIQAESIAYVVSKHFGMECNAPNYLALWDADSAKIKDNLNVISKTARAIIEAIEPKEVTQ